MWMGTRCSHRLFPVALVIAVAACGGDNQQQAAETPPAAEPAADTTVAPPAAAPAAAPDTGGATAANLPAGITPAMVQEGQQLFTGSGNCYTCHGPDANGTALAPSLKDAEWLWFDHPPTVDELEARIKEGVPQPKSHPAPMPPMGGATLTDQQLESVAAYVYSLSQG
jgi:mono/diheme cytochrome c family protein